MKDFKPGHLSPALQAALGISENCPPPWLYNMQKYGPPPNYVNLKIPGVNMLMPQGSDGGAGRLFTNSKGFTIYADCHGLNKAVYQKRENRKDHWGSLKEADYDEVDGVESSYESESEQASDFDGQAAY